MRLERHQEKNVRVGVIRAHLKVVLRYPLDREVEIRSRQLDKNKQGGGPDRRY